MSKEYQNVKKLPSSSTSPFAIAALSFVYLFDREGIEISASKKQVL